MKKNAKRVYILKAIEAIFGGLNLAMYDEGEPIMIELMDKDQKTLSKNWLSNDGWWISSVSETINQVDTVDIQHYCWNRADTILHLVRFVRVYWRQRVETAESEFYNHEVGRTYEIFNLQKGGEFKSNRYTNTWHDHNVINWKWRYENRHHIGDWDSISLEERVAYINSHNFGLDFYPESDYTDYEKDDYTDYEEDDYDED